MLALEQLLPGSRRALASVPLRREFRLAPGTTLACVEGARVEPMDVVATEILPGRLHVLDVAQLLSVAPQQLRGKLLVSQRQQVEAGQPLARAGRLSRRVLLSPASGTIYISHAQGLLLLQSESQRREWRAGLRGVVSEASTTRVVVEASGTLLEGVWASGGPGFGLLRLLTRDPAAELPLGAINAGLRGTVPIVARLSAPEALHALRDVGLGGLLLGSMEVELLAVARTMPFPILLLEGFGVARVSEPLWALASSVDGKDGFLTGAPEGLWGQARPALMVPTTRHGADAPPPPAPLARGARVRLLNPRQLGQLGTVESAGVRGPQAARLLGHGCRVRLDSGETILLSSTCLERLLL